MMNLGYLLPPLVAAAIGVILLVTVLVHKPKERSHWVFSLILITLVTWSLITFAMRSSPDVERALFWDRIVIIFVFAMPVLYYHFSLVLISMRGLKSLLYMSYAFLIAILVLRPTDLLVQRMEIATYGYAPILGLAMFPIVAFAYVLGIMAIYNLFRAYRASNEGRKRNRLLYIIIAMLFPIIGATFEVFPTIYPTVIFGNIAFCSFTTLAILRYNLLDIQVIIRKSVFYLLISTLVAIPYVGMLVLLQRFLEVEQWWWHALTILILAIILRPVYSWLQQRVDRVFYRDRYDYLRALERFSQEAQNITNLEELGLRMVELVSGALRSSSVYLFLPSKDEGDLVVVSYTGSDTGSERPSPQIVLRKSSMFVKWLRTHHGVLSAKEFDVISQLQSLPLTDKSALEKIGGKLYVPIETRDGELVGLLVLGEKLSQQSYSDEDGRLLEALSNNLSINLENARLYSDVLREVVERKRAEEERLKLERKVQINSRLTSIGEMAAGIAHEINNPLTPILGFADMLLKRDLPEDVKDDLQIIRDSARRTADVTRRLLLFARQSKPMRTLCNINEVVETTLQLRAYYLKTNNIKVITELDLELPQTMADAGQLQQVVLNLIMNAEYSMVHARGGGNLLIKTEKMGNIICLSVKDDGPGISKENMEKLFTPFFSTKKVGEGTGLGLSTCHGIIAEHNGRIYAESEVGKGATFIVELPIIRQQKEEEAKLSESDTREAGEAVKARILVVDDEPAITQVLKRVLTGEGYEVEITDKAKAALGLIKGGKYALILLDIKLPDMSGIELYQHLDKTAMSLTQRIIFITGDVLGTDTMDFFSRTGASYVTKPFDMEQLKKEVKRKLTKRG